MSLAEEDKKWFEALLQHQSQIFERQSQIFEQGMDRLSRQFDEKLTLQGQQFDIKLERVETRLLTEFHKWASPIEARQRTHAAALRAIDLEMEALSDRVKKIEDRP